MKKRLFSKMTAALAAVAVTFTMIPATTAFAGGGYGIFVNGVEFNAMRTTIDCGDGTATLELPEDGGETYTLTLTDAAIDKSHEIDGMSALIYCDEPVDIKLVGDNKLTLNSSSPDYDAIGLFAGTYLDISGEAGSSLDVTVSGASTYSIGIYGGLKMSNSADISVNTTADCATEEARNSAIMSGVEGFIIKNTGTITAKCDSKNGVNEGCAIHGYQSVENVNGGEIYAVADGGKASYGVKSSAIFENDDDSYIEFSGRKYPIYLEGGGPRLSQDISIVGSETFCDSVENMTDAEFVECSKQEGNFQIIKLEGQDVVVLSASIGTKPADDDDDECPHENWEMHDAAEATCTKAGYTGDKYCLDCKKVIETGKTIDPLGHEYAPVEYTWDGAECTAVLACEANDPNEPEDYIEETVTGVYVRDTEANCNNAETGHYKATFENTKLGTAETKKGSVTKGDALGHNFGTPKYTWNKNECTATVECRKCNGDGSCVTEAVTATYVADVAATCTDPGNGHYEAKFISELFDTQMTETGSVAGTVLSTEHKHTEIRGAKAATCSNNGYTGDTYCLDCQKVVKEGETIDRLGHEYGKPTYEWFDNVCVGTIECVRGDTDAEGGTEGEFVTGVYVKDTDATCKSPEKGHYEATFTHEGFTNQSTAKNSVTKGEPLAHVPSAWKYDKNSHWTECTNSGCGEIVDKKADHIDEDKDGICDVCEYIIEVIVPPAPSEPDPTITRVFGETRYETAAEIAKATYEKADTVVLASGNNYADALAGTPLAYALKAPIMLVQGSELDRATQNAIEKLGAKNIVILGGENAVSKEASDRLTELGFEVKRIFGDTRYDTAIEIAVELEKVAGKSSQMFIATGTEYADSVSIGSIAAMNGTPIIYATLEENGNLPNTLGNWLAAHKGAQTTILGGTDAVSKDIEDEINEVLDKDAARIGGANRYATNALINDKFASLFTGDCICIATGSNFPDALTGSVYAAVKKAPIYLAGSSFCDEQIAAIEASGKTNFIIFGGTSAVPVTVEDIVK